jgi:hypothetical protein
MTGPQWWWCSSGERGDLPRLHGLVPGAALGIQKAKQAFQRPDVRAVPDEGLLAFGDDELVVLQFFEVVGQR